MRRYFHKLATRLALGAAVVGGSTIATNHSLLAQEQSFHRVVFLQDDEEEDEESEQSPAKFWIGIMLKPVEGDLARYLGTQSGILVDRVMEESPADEAGLKEGDLLIELSDESLSEPSDLIDMMASIKEGKKLTFRIKRQGEDMELTLEPEVRPERLSRLGSEDVIAELDLNGDVEDAAEVRKILEKIRLRNGEEVNVFSLGGGPMYSWIGGDEAESEDINLQLQKAVDGKEIEVRITRKDDEPANIVVIENGVKQEFTEEELDELPGEISVLVNPLLKGKKGMVELRAMPRRLRAIVDVDGKDVAEQVRALANEYRVQVLGDAKNIAVMNEQSEAKVAALRDAVEQLKKEVKELRAQLKKSKK